MSTTPPRPQGGDLPPDFETHLPDDLMVRPCYRHPDRETGVSCSNCGRPICHECMISAPVGFRCPECVREQSARGSRAKVVTRGQIRSRWGAGGVMSGAAPATTALVVINVAFFILSFLVNQSWGSLAPVQVIIGHEYYRMFTTMFLHAGIFHILFNMWALWVIGGFLERAIGTTKFLIVYFVSGFAGSVLVVLVAPLGVSVVGASGAIFGLFGALLIHALMNRGRDFQSRALVNQLLFLLVINLALSFTGNIAWQAHIGGLITGVASMFVLTLGGRKDARAPFGRADLMGMLVIVAVLVALTYWRVTTFLG